MQTPFAQKLASLAHLDHRDHELLAEVQRNPRKVARARDIIEAGERPDNVHLIHSGLACRYTILEDGRRQITAYLLPGDICDLHVFILKAMDHAIGVLSDAQVVDFPRSSIEQMLARPNLATALLKTVLIDEATLRQWVVNVARRPAPVAIAHLFCELHLRLLIVGLANKDSFYLPITQEDLGDTVGLSIVHVNRSLRDLREAGLTEFRDGEVYIPNVAALREYGGFDDGYFHLGQRPYGT